MRKLKRSVRIPLHRVDNNTPATGRAAAVCFVMAVVLALVWWAI